MIESLLKFGYFSFIPGKLKVDPSLVYEAIDKYYPMLEKSEKHTLAQDIIHNSHVGIFINPEPRILVRLGTFTTKSYTHNESNLLLTEEQTFAKAVSKYNQYLYLKYPVWLKDVDKKIGNIYLYKDKQCELAAKFINQPEVLSEAVKSNLLTPTCNGKALVIYGNFKGSFSE